MIGYLSLTQGGHGYFSEQGMNYLSAGAGQGGAGRGGVGWVWVGGVVTYSAGLIVTILRILLLSPGIRVRACVHSF